MIEKYELQGIHLSTDNRKSYESLKIHGYPIISTSCHSIVELKHNKNKYEYLFLSPIFNSISKIGYNSNFSVDELLEAKSAEILDNRVIALGGINKDNIKLIKHYGFGGAAVLGALWNIATK